MTLFCEMKSLKKEYGINLLFNLPLLAKAVRKTEVTANIYWLPLLASDQCLPIVFYKPEKVFLPFFPAVMKETEEQHFRSAPSMGAFSLCENNKSLRARLLLRHFLKIRCQGHNFRSCPTLPPNMYSRKLY